MIKTWNRYFFKSSMSMSGDGIADFRRSTPMSGDGIADFRRSTPMSGDGIADFRRSTPISGDVIDGFLFFCIAMSIYNRWIPLFCIAVSMVEWMKDSIFIMHFVLNIEK
jgi:hypothetical protein